MPIVFASFFIICNLLSNSFFSPQKLLITRTLHIMTEIYEDFYKQTPYLILFLWLTFHTMSLEMYFFIFQSLKTTGIFSLFFFLNAALFCFPLHCFILERETLYHVCYLWFPYFISLINNHHLDHKLILNKIIPVLFEFCLCFISLTIKHFVLAWALKWIIITTPQQEGASRFFSFLHILIHILCVCMSCR